MAEARSISRDRKEIDRADANRPVRIRKIGVGDLRQALAQGLDDFAQQPSHLVFLGLIYPIVGFLLARASMDGEWVMLLFPIMAGFALVGPFAAIGIYEISRRREQGLDTSWRHAFDVLRSPSRLSILLLGVLLMLLFVAWLAAALVIYRRTLGFYEPAGIMELVGQVLTTRAGWALLIVGNGVGFVFAAGVLAISVVSFPLLLDRRVDAFTAMGASLRAVGANPGPMALWGLIVAAALVAGSIPFFVGLAVAVPVLGHATWHLYRKVVER
ncbi:DUF2189 domain-containing protein [Phreatobacter sp.]|uniref:DUF2189 domain-containing protein n=1 Tax=Phreatobacter sp. TaxID=1966341 RepID=UPI003F7185EE